MVVSYSRRLKCHTLSRADMASAMRTASNAASRGLDRLKDAGASLNDRTRNSSLFAEDRREDRAVMNEIRMIGGALVAIVIIALVLTEVYNAVEVEEGPFEEIVTSAETTGVAAITLLVVGLLVLAASVIMRFMGGGFGR